MKKRILSLVMAFVMVLGMLPGTALAWVGSEDYVIVTAEKYDTNGTGTFLLEPTRISKSAVSAYYLDEWISAAYGEDCVKINADSYPYEVTGYADATQTDGWLDNGDLGDSSKWLVWLRATNKYGEDRRYTNPGDYSKISALDMVRLVFVADGAQINMDTVKKDDLLILTSGLTEEQIDSAGDAYQDALDMLLNKAATQTEVNGAYAALEKALLPPNPATSIQLSPTPVTVGVGQTKTVTATLETENGEESTDTVTWSVADTSIATVNAATGVVTGVSAGSTTLTAKANDTVSASVNITVSSSAEPSTDPYVYFEYSDGRANQYMAADGSFTLSSLDQGYFRVANVDATPWWENEEKIDAGSGSVTYHWYVDRETGEWQPSGQQPTEPIVVTAGGFTKSFTINYEATSGITELKTYIDDTEVSNNAPYEVTGCISNVAVTTMGKNAKGNWIEIPVQALNYDTSDNVNYNFRFIGNCLEINRAGNATMTVSLKGESVSTTFGVVCNPVMAKSMEVIVPVTFEISDWDAVPDQYVGLRPFSDGGYTIEFTPANATNRDVTWTALNPEVAEHFTTHSAGIVPKKAGKATFTVTNVEDPTLTQDVTVTFTYKNPLTAAASSEKSYTLKKGDIQPFTITVTPENATEQRFTWTYSRNGIVEVSDEIKTSEDGLTAWTEHQIKALKPGIVTVTGTPWDTTGGCKPVTFIVTVTESGDVTPADVSQLVADGISGAQRYLKANLPEDLTYGYEWTIFSLLRSGAAIDQSKLEAYLDSVERVYRNTSDGSSEAMKPTTLARVALTLGVLGEDASDFRDLDLIKMLYNSDRITEGSNEAIWALIALDSKDYAVPESAAWTREALIQRVLSYQNTTSGGFGLTGTDQISVDVTAMALQALAPYCNDEHESVQTAVDLALTWLQKQLGADCVMDGNAESTAQVLTALAALGINPTAKDSGFTAGASSLITGLISFQLENGGFKHTADSSAAVTLSTIQALYSLEAYNRYANIENALYDLTDVAGTSVRSVLENRLNEANSLIEGNYTEESWAAMAAARAAAQEALNTPNAADEDLRNADDTLAAAIRALVKVSGQPGSDVDSNAINVYVTIVNQGKVVMPQTSVSVKDTNSSGSFDVDDALYAAHKAAYPGGAAAGYASAVGDFGLSITKLWGDTSGAVGYWLNNNSCWSLADTVKAGDHVVAFVYEDSTYWSDSYSKFNSFTYSAKTGEAVTLTLEKAGYDESWNPVFSPLPGAAITAYDSSFTPLSAGSYSVTDKRDGSYSVTFDNAGFYYLTASCDDPLIVPAVCTVTVSAASGGSSSPGQDQPSAYISVSDPNGTTYLSKTKYSLSSGETAFSLLLKTGLDVQSRNSEYGVYVESIQGLAEFAEGPGSGWMYQVNGQFPEVSASAYTVSSSDYVQWVYTRDLGNDVGGSGGGSTVSSSDQAAADKVAELIAAIGTVTDASGDKIAAARNGYDALTAAQKKLVSNYALLTAAEQAYGQLTGTEGLPFTDVAGHWALDAIRYVYEQGLMTGTSAATFSPEKTITRGMIAAILYRLEGSPDVSGGVTFSDVDSGKYYASAIQWAQANGIVEGYTSGRFGPDDAITREQLAAILYRYAAYKKLDLSASADLSGFADRDQISAYAADALSWANAAGLITGTKADTLSPKGSATRAQAAAILMRFLENTGA